MVTLREQQRTHLVALAEAISAVQREVLEAHETTLMSEVKFAVHEFLDGIKGDRLLPEALRLRLVSLAESAWKAIVGGGTEERTSAASLCLAQAERSIKACLNRPSGGSSWEGEKDHWATYSLVEGDLLEQGVEVIVNAWNRNIIPWWLLLPQGVSGAIKRRGGYQPFIELGRAGPIPLGGAVMTAAGRLPYQAIIHVAGIDLLWRASEDSIRRSVQSAMALVTAQRFGSVAFPVIGAGSGGFSGTAALATMRRAFDEIAFCARVVIVKYRRPARRTGW